MRSAHDHNHEVDENSHHHERPASSIELRARALEALLVEKGLVSTDAIDAMIELYENDIGPQNGAKVVARAWVDPGYRERLLTDATAAIAEPPSWYKSAPYRARMVSEPRAVLREFGLELPAETTIRVWDSTAEVRYLVLPERPANTEGWDEEALAAIVTRDAMIGVAVPVVEQASPA
jgi:nitrile hydratase